jgi:hypothetical protein
VLPKDRVRSIVSHRTVLDPYSEIYSRPAVFSLISQLMDELRFSLMHLDVGLYANVLAELELFILAPGGSIVTHDCSTLPAWRWCFPILCPRKRQRGRTATKQTMVVV